MQIAVIGAGALGGLVGAHLSESGQDVILADSNPARAKLLSESGLYIAEAGHEERCCPVRVVSSCDDMSAVDLVFLAVKSYQTRAALGSVTSLIGPDTLVLSLQNGIGNTAVMAEVVDSERVLCGITYHSVQHVGPNRLRYRVGIKPIQISPYKGEITSRVRTVGRIFTEAGLKTDVVENVDHAIWQKLLHNAIVNPVSALTGLTCREMLDDESLIEFMRELCDEIVAVMRARGVPIVDEEDPFRPVIGSLTALGKNRPSMWQDLARGMPTEIDAINGAIADEAERVGLAAPHCRAIVRFIHSRERQKLRRRRQASVILEGAAKGREETETRGTRMDSGGGMSGGRVALETAPRLRELLRETYRDLQAAADDPARRIAWCSGMGPVEIVRAFGLTPYFPENHAALIGASRATGRYIPRALAEGFSQFASSAMTSDIGAMLVGDSPLVTVYGIDGPPPPDVILYNTNHGQSLMRWFEYYGAHFGAPVLGLHPPAALHTVDEMEVAASTRRMLRLGERLGDVLGTKLDMDRLAEIVSLSARAAELWQEILDLARNVPAPMTYFDMLIHMAPMVLMRGTTDAIEYYTLLKAELEDRIASGLAAVPGERFRFYWEGPPIWCALRPIAELFLEHRAAIVASTYSGVFALKGLDPDNPIESLATAYTGIFHNRSDAYKADYLEAQFNDFGVDAVVYHEGRTSPEHSNVRYGLEVALRRRTGLPSVVLEADTHDLRLFSMDQLQRQLNDFIELREREAARKPNDRPSEQIQSGVEP